MSNQKQQDIQARLVVKRVFNATIDRVFNAWTKAEVLASWFGPAGFIVTRTDTDLQVGGKYEIVLQPPAGDAIRHFGEYVEIIDSKRLVFTWILENQACQGSQNQHAETLVSIDFRQINTATEIVLTHERLPSPDSYDGHKQGWNDSFESLAEFMLKNP